MTIDTNVLDEIHRFWFGELSGPQARNDDKAEMWFKQSDETDRIIAERFDTYIQPAAETDWDLAALTRAQSVALVILLDQFPRNIFRTSGEAFAFDPVARDIASRLIEPDMERFFHAERTFVCLPFMHSEAIADQDHCVFLVAREALTAPDAWKDRYRNNLDFATKHRDLIRKFGRFPHRNAALGRASTEDELAFLKEHGRGF